MLQFILRRLGLVIPTFIGITLLTFAFVHMIPGDPVMIMAGERGISPERHAQLLAELGLDKPMWQQYLHYIWGVMHGDLGISMKSRIPVWEEFVPRFQATLEPVSYTHLDVYKRQVWGWQFRLLLRANCRNVLALNASPWLPAFCWD